MQNKHDANTLAAMLDPGPMRLEMGIERLASGALVVACRTAMRGCTGAMLNWWFTYFETDEHLRWWHPLDHRQHLGWDSKWEKGKNLIGATIRATESLGDIPPVTATIKFLEPAEFFDAEDLQRATANHAVSAIVCAGIGFGDDVVLDDAGVPTGGRMMHVARDNHEGLVLRSRFVLGLDAHPVPDEIGLGLMRHCHSEFTYLAKALPSLFYGDATNPRPADIW